MIKLKNLLKAKSTDIFIPRRMEDRVERLIKNYVRNGSKGNLYFFRNMDLTELPEILSNVTVERDFDCSNNLLTSLSGAPKSVGGHFNCTNNAVKFTEAQVRAVCDVSGKVIV